MFLLLTVLFLVVPIVELYVIVQVADGIGTLETIGLLILVSFLGAWLVRREGMGVMRKVQAQLAEGKMPTTQLVDGALILFAGALMLTPGFVTDAFGVFLLLPPTRILVRKALMTQFKGRITVGTIGARMGPNVRFGAPIFDVDSTEQVSPDHVDLTRDNDDTEPPSLPC
jgi:UPF0716 protein FxsA